MKTRLLRKIRKRYSYIWRDTIDHEWKYQNDDGSWTHEIDRRMTLVMIDEHTKKYVCSLDHYGGTYSSIERFLRMALTDKVYDEWKSKRAGRDKERIYKRMKRLQKKIHPNIIDKEITLLLDQPPSA